MNDDNKIQLARRAVASKHWRWMPGMLCEGVRIEAITKGGNPLDCEGYVPVGGPDLDDPATLGCLLALMREAWGYAGAHCVYCPHMEEWHVVIAPDGEWAGLADATEAEALVSALEAAP